MAKRMRLTDDDILDLFDSSGDEMDVEQSDEDVDFDPETAENESDCSNLHELASSGDEDMDVSGVGGANTSAGDISADAESEAESDASIEDDDTNSAAANRGPIWRPYAPTDSDLLKLPFTVSNPGPRLPTSRQYENELSFFQLFFTIDIIAEIVQETNRYAREKIAKAQPLGKRSIWKTWKDTTLEEMKAMLGVVLNMGMHAKSDMKEYFSKKWTERMPFFVDVFSRERFFQLYWMLHLQQSVGQGFRGDKVHNLVTHMNAKCQEYYSPNEFISVDESTIGFKGRVIWKCYNPNKPTKWGLRVYTMCESESAYIVAFVPYYGKFTTDGLVRPDLPFTSRIVLHLCNMLSSKGYGSGYHIFTDRFYTSPILCEELRKLSFHLTGTVMPSRKGMPNELSKKKRKRKVHEVIAFKKSDDSMALQWKDKRVVTMLSSVYNTQCENEERILGNQQPTTVAKPVVISRYTKYMGGVDKADHYCGSYAFLRKTAKWWRKMFFWLFEVAIVNSFILYNIQRRGQGLKSVTHKKYRKNLVIQLVGKIRNKNSRKRGRNSDVESIERLSGRHFVAKIPNGRSKDCAVCSDRRVKRRETVYQCETCERKPGLHPDKCFKKYHTEKHYR